MTTILQARDQLDAAIVAAGIAVAGAPGKATTPCATIYGEGITGDAHALRGQARATFRVTLLAGAWDAESSSRTLTGLVQTVITTVRELAGWQLGTVGRDHTRQLTGGLALAADITASRMVDI